MHLPSLIERKRDGGELSESELRALVEGFTRGDIPDYQVTAWAMAVYFQGMTPEETSHLTRAMMESGRVLRYPAGSPPKVDKHSTGGVGDKVSLILAPLLACAQVWVPMISGRGLGFTGGTLDKLESIPGFDVNLPEQFALQQLERIGVFMIGQTAGICPADKKLYALRDVSGTVPSSPLIIASIMSKKLAESLDRLVLDVKFGSGAFMQTRGEGEALAAGCAAVARQMGVESSHLLTPMDEPVGKAVGNALEVAEAVQTLQGTGPPDLVCLVLDLAVRVAGVPRETLNEWLADGTAWRKFVALIEAQGGEANALERITQVHTAPVVQPFRALREGHLRRLDAGRVGRTVVQLGGGRAQASDTIDFAVGFSGIRKVGDHVTQGEPLFFIHARTEADVEQAYAQLADAIEISEP